MSAPVDRKMDYINAWCPSCRTITQHRRSSEVAMWACENIDRPQHRPVTESSTRPTSIYVAGASAELDRATRVLKQLQAEPLNAHYHVTKDWSAQVRAERIEGGRHDDQLESNLRQQIAAENVHAVFRAEILWLLLPPKETTTVGMWIELGVGLCKRLIGLQLSSRLMLSSTADTPFIICSGDDAPYVFTADANLVFADDDAAMDWLKQRVDL